MKDLNLDRETQIDFAAGANPAPIPILTEDTIKTEDAMKDFRCKFCHRLLAKVGEAKKVEIKCPKCKTMNLYSDDMVVVVQVDEDYLRRKIQKGKVSYNFVTH